MKKSRVIQSFLIGVAIALTFWATFIATVLIAKQMWGVCP